MTRIPSTVDGNVPLRSSNSAVSSSLLHSLELSSLLNKYIHVSSYLITYMSGHWSINACKIVRISCAVIRFSPSEDLCKHILDNTNHSIACPFWMIWMPEVYCAGKPLWVINRVVEISSSYIIFVASHQEMSHVDEYKPDGFSTLGIILATTLFL